MMRRMRRCGAPSPRSRSRFPHPGRSGTYFATHCLGPVSRHPIPCHLEDSGALAAAQPRVETGSRGSTRILGLFAELVHAAPTRSPSAPTLTACHASLGRCAGIPPPQPGPVRFAYNRLDFPSEPATCGTPRRGAASRASRCLPTASPCLWTGWSPRSTSASAKSSRSAGRAHHVRCCAPPRDRRRSTAAGAIVVLDAYQAGIVPDRRALRIGPDDA